jgi:hypothetical protein
VTALRDHFILPPLPRADGVTYRCRCVCGWVSEPRERWQDAEVLGDGHVCEVAARRIFP